MKILKRLLIIIVVFFTFTLTVYASTKTKSLTTTYFKEDAPTILNQYTTKISTTKINAASSSLKEITTTSTYYQTYTYNDQNIQTISVPTHTYHNLNEYYYSPNSTLAKIQYIPPYYSQLENTWANKYYGSYTFGQTGCLPTTLAMALEAILQRQVLPTEIADFLYNQTNEFNKTTKGSTNLAIPKVASHYNIKITGVNTSSELIDALRNGKIVIMTMGNGKYASNDYAHALILYKYNDGLTNVYDPLNSLNNTPENISFLWQQKNSSNLVFALG